MISRILLVAATEAEADSFRKIPDVLTAGDGYSFNGKIIDLLVTGIGTMATSWTLCKWFSAGRKPGLAVNIGIAGTFNNDIHPGEVVVPVSDCFADSGIETQAGFSTLFDAGLEDPDKFPFRSGKITVENPYITMALSFLKPVNSITVNTSSGSVRTIERLSRKFNPDIETMEGATFFYICSGEKIPFLALRAISNRVEPRNKDNWNIGLALDNLSERLREFILMV